MKNIQNQKENKKNVSMLLGIVLILLLVAGATFAYFALSATNNVIGGNAGTVDLSLTVTKVLPNTTGTDDIIITSFDDLATNLNQNCIDSDGDFALCQLYQVHLTNGANGVNTNVKGSVSFNNTTTSNLAWISLGNSYSSSTTYTSEMLGSSFHTSSAAFTNFVDSYLLSSGTSVDFYLLVWVNESEEEQTDEGSYSGTIRFEDSNGKGVTSTFSS